MRLGYTISGLRRRAIERAAQAAEWAGPWVGEEGWRDLPGLGGESQSRDLGAALGLPEPEWVAARFVEWDGQIWAMVGPQVLIPDRTATRPVVVPLGTEPTDPVAAECRAAAAAIVAAAGPGPRVTVASWTEDGMAQISTHLDWRHLRFGPRAERVLVRSADLAAVLAEIGTRDDPRGVAGPDSLHNRLLGVMCSTPATYDGRLCQWVLDRTAEG